jgi:hypothetical protein
MRRITGLAMAALLALAVAGCGGDDDTASDYTTTTTSDSGSTTDDGTTGDDGGDDGSTDGDIAAGLIDSDCRFLLAGAYLNPLAAAVPGAETDFEGSAEQLEAIADEAPEEIQDAMATLAEGFAEFAEVLQDVDLQDPQSFADPDVQAALEDLEAVFDEEYEQAGETVSAYVADNCGG